MKKTTFQLCIMAMLLFISCKAGLMVQDNSVEANEEYQDFISYYLPKTVLKIKIPVERSIYENGGLIEKVESENTNYAEEFRNFFYANYGWKPLEKNKDIFSIGEKIQFIPITLPDKNKNFTLSFTKSRAVAQSTGITLNKDGIITSGEFAQENKTFEYVTKGVELLASSAAAFYPLSKSSDSTPNLAQIQRKAREYRHLLKNWKVWPIPKAS